MVQMELNHRSFLFEAIIQDAEEPIADLMQILKT